MKTRLLALAVALFVPFGEAVAEEPPSALVKAIARQESGLNPLAVNVAGKSHYPATREEAENLIREALTAGKSFDVGKMQINNWWMKRFSIDRSRRERSLGKADTGGRNRQAWLELASRGQIPFARPGARQAICLARLPALCRPESLQ